ncbi:unnamed protein product [Cladocopium goreaui]|uniref:Ribosomal large subunit pseudouridine synthase D n=1 Tax=Cladocopium goreaui TaxID=2562237 RepID=A0A9P1C1Y7_9DINO|nr:unnamed protein product [Cladocopium goreaui]
MMAAQIFQELPQRRLAPDRISFNALLSACAGASLWTRALELLEQMTSCAVEPGSITRNVVITACENALQWEVVLQLLEPDKPNGAPQSATNLHHSAWWLSKQSPSKISKQRALALAQRAVGKLQDFKVKELVSLLRSFSSMLVSDPTLFGRAAERLVLDTGTTGMLQTQEFANLAWAFASTGSNTQIFPAIQRALVQRGQALVEDGKSVEDDPVARDYAEGMLGVVWSLNYAGLLSEAFLNFATSTLKRLTGSAAQLAESWPRTSCSDVAADAPWVVVESRQAMVLLKPAGWQVDDDDQVLSDDVWSLSTFVSQMLPLRRCPLIGAKPFSRGFLHRLDVPTSGLILVAKSVSSFYDLRLQLASGRLQRDYQALCHGSLSPSRHEVRAAVHWWSDGRSSSSSIGWFGRPSITTYRPGDPGDPGTSGGTLRGRGVALTMRCIRIVTGRKHQIRVHSAHIGHPVVCDGRYSTTATYQLDLNWCPRNFLHRYSLQFCTDGTTMTVSSSLPNDLADALRRGFMKNAEFTMVHQKC